MPDDIVVKTNIVLLSIFALSLINIFNYALNYFESISVSSNTKLVTERFVKNQKKYGMSFLFLSVISIVFYASNITALIFYFLPINFQNQILTWVVLLIAGTGILFLFSWYFPRVVFNWAPKFIFKVLKMFFILFHKILYPISQIFYEISVWFVRVMLSEKGKINDDVLIKSNLDVYNIKSLLNENFQVKQELIRNSQNFSDKKIKHILIPRNEIFCIDIKSSVEDLRSLFVDSKLSKIIVIDGQIDKVIGYVHLLDLFKNPYSIKDIIHQIPVFPENISLAEFVEKLKSERKSIAWIIDEFGGTCGIAAMEDALEEIFGEIKDEHDLDFEFLEKKISQDEFLFSGRLELEYISKKYNLEFSEVNEAETLSGYLISYLDEIPKSGSIFNIDDLQFKILQVNPKTIKSVFITKIN